MPGRHASTCHPQRSRRPSNDPAGDALGTMRMNSVRFPPPTGPEVRCPQIGQCLGLAHGAGAPVQHDAPAAASLLVELVHFKRDARRPGQLRQDAIGRGAEVGGALVHGICDRQDLRKIGGLPRYAAEMIGLHEIQALLAA